MSTDYIELEVQSCFSLLMGGSTPKALMKTAEALGYDALAITDRDSLYGMVRAMEESERRGVRLIIGCEVTIDDHSVEPATVLIHVENELGYSNLCRLLTDSHARYPQSEPRRVCSALPRNCHAGLPLDTLCQYSEGLWASVDPAAVERWGADRAWDNLREAFRDRLSIRVIRHTDGEDPARERRALRAHDDYGVPVCATNAVKYAVAEHKPIYDVLHCIREGYPLVRAGRKLSVNAEAHLKPPQEMQRLFAHQPEWLLRTREIADACRFSLRKLQFHFPCELAARAETPMGMLRRLVEQGAHRRYPRGVPPSVRDQLTKELWLIEQRAVAPFFLSVQEVVELARERDILCQGRGSAANSAVCYCLGITALDPAHSSLLFERFLSSNRSEPPDIDVDFEHERREEVIQDIYQRYGRDRAAMVCEVNCYRPRSAVRDVGHAFGISRDDLERLSATLSWRENLEVLDEQRLRLMGVDGRDHRIRLALQIAEAIQGYPRHLSTHVGGFVLSATSLSTVAPIEPASMPNRSIITWDKDDLETLGFFKVDVLGLGMLTALRRTLALAQSDERIRADTAIEQLAKVPPEDPAVYEALCRADTVGVFQVESRAQMSMLPRLRPDHFYDLVVEVALVRPGPIQGGMVHPYLRRREEKRKDPHAAVNAPHALLEHILNRTLGIPIFQEQVMQIAIDGAGYTGSEADQLRRDMAAWKRTGNLERHRERLLQGFSAHGISAQFAEQLYEQMKGFADYGFPESHAASFAHLVYASAWLKVHHPAAFAAALVNSQPMGFYSPNTLLQDARRHGVQLLPICVVKSQWDCTLEPDEPYLRVGLRGIKGLGESVGRRIEQARAFAPFASVNDLRQRARLSTRDLHFLAEAGALEALTPERRQAMWMAMAPRVDGLWQREGPQGQKVNLPRLADDELLLLDYVRTGFSVGDHPMRHVRKQLPPGVLGSKAFALAHHRARVQTAGMVICRQRPQTASGVVFITLEDEHGFMNWLLYGRVFERLRHLATGYGFLLGEGTVERNGDVIYLIVDKLKPLDFRGYQANMMSRDFH
ncbi:MAG: error-prone DNA polymerase [Myxococcaceae bacterium]|nr:error-prone DNA polymerase [Myxococcaceae bacterium]